MLFNCFTITQKYIYQCFSSIFHLLYLQIYIEHNNINFFSNFLELHIEMLNNFIQRFKTEFTAISFVNFSDPYINNVFRIFKNKLHKNKF